tara:strand:+ start:2038 stop:2448 length:411 start_codon:yes stop_codon:yes gene_type:complete
MSDIEVKKAKVKKVRSEAQLAHTKKLVALNKQRAEDRKTGKAPPLKKKVSIKIKKEKPIYKASPLVNDGLESDVDETDESEDFSDDEYSLAQALYQETLDNEDPDFVDTPPKEDIKADSPVSYFSTSKKKKRKVYR